MPFAQNDCEETVLFYDIFANLCARNGITPSAAAREIGIDKSNVSKWKHRELTPRAEALGKIADYFNVSVGALILAEQPKNTPAEAEVSGDKAIVIKALGSLPPEGQKDLMEYIRFLLMKYGESSKLDAPLEE